MSRQCIKCGSADIYTRYRAKGERLESGWGGTEKGYAQDECLYHICRDCGYTWVAPTRDSYGFQPLKMR